MQLLGSSESEEWIISVVAYSHLYIMRSNFILSIQAIKGVCCPNNKGTPYCHFA